MGRQGWTSVAAAPLLPNLLAGRPARQPQNSLHDKKHGNVAAGYDIPYQYIDMHAGLSAPIHPESGWHAGATVSTSMPSISQQYSNHAVEKPKQLSATVRPLVIDIQPCEVLQPCTASFDMPMAGTPRLSQFTQISRLLQVSTLRTPHPAWAHLGDIVVSVVSMSRGFHSAMDAQIVSRDRGNARVSRTDGES